MKQHFFIHRGGFIRWTGMAGLFAMPAMAHLANAHVEPGLDADHLWSAWQFTPDIVIGTLLAAVIYGTGLWRGRNKQQERRLSRAVFFYTGLASIFLALQSPLDTLSEHVFALHQVQHFLLHSLGPMLLMLAIPEGPLIGGMPERLRRYVLAPIVMNRVVRATFGFLSRTTVATFLYVGSLYFWQLPEYHEITLLDEPVHYLMHVSMLFTGLLFFRRIFDPRPAPAGTGYGVRLVMLCAAITGNILIGAFTTLKSHVLYPVYDTFGRLWHMNALTDELLGGIVLWIPSSMMCVVAALIVIRLWGARETKVDGWRKRGLANNAPPMSAPSPRPPHSVTAASSGNRALAYQLLAISLVVMVGVVAVALLDHLSIF